ncbi:MAG: sugar phosphate isomerase/epimerase [Planctomycetes bacterium]|nr:sugar phosphate isomerase/epimerase [Planctomycetota bacterium]
MRSAITICLVPEAASGPFVFHGDLDQGCHQAAALGFDGVEIFAPGPEALPADPVAAILRRHGLGLAALGSGAGFLKHKLSLTSADANVRRGARQFLKEMILAGGRLGAPVILGSMQGRHEGDVSRPQALDWLAEAVAELADVAGEMGQHFLVEPLNRYETNLLRTVDEALDLLGRVGRRNAKVLGDLFHMNIEEASWAASVAKVGASLGHVHFADSNRRAMGLGHTDFKAVVGLLQGAGYQGYLSAEIFPLPDPVEAGRQTLKAFREATRDIPDR